MRYRKALIGVGVVIIAGVAWIVGRIYYTVSHLPEAYAAWDTGTLLVQYLEKNEGRWPLSWNDLATAGRYEPGVYKGASGVNAEELRQYVDSLKSRVAIDWAFDPRHPTNNNPVTTIAGGKFGVVWFDPNDMVRDHFKERAATRPTTTDLTQESPPESARTPGPR